MRLLGRDAKARHEGDAEYNDAYDERDCAGDDEGEMDCGLMRDGQCSQAGTEHCDFGCPKRHSELFVGSAAWIRKHSRATSAKD